MIAGLTMMTNNQELEVKKARALDVKTGFQDVVDRMRTFWVEVQNALKHPFLGLVASAVFASLDTRIANLTIQVQ